MHALSTEELSKTYSSGLFTKQRVAALTGVSLQVAPGEIFSLLGPNGAGKTTFIKILLSLTFPTSGSATMLGETLPNVRVRRRSGYLPENHRYPGYLTGAQVLMFFGQLGGATRADVASRVGPLLDLVGLSQWRTMKVKKYSKGMMQRLGLAQALINDPAIVFLDEPTDGVDPVGRKEIREILKRLKDEGKTVFLNSHLLSEVELISDRVAILDKGRLVKVGTVDELTTEGSRYRFGISGSLPPDLKTEASALVIAFESGADYLIAELKSDAALNAFIDLLRKYNVTITGVTKQRTSLEDSFLSLIRREVAS
jgi:ABC-2 type transport system ATP-binding protein